MRKIYQEFESANILATTIEHNGYKGGDLGHGSFIKITFENIASTSMFLNDSETDNFTFTFKGDTERDTFIDSLKFILFELENNK